MILQAGTYEKDSIVAGWDPITHLDLQPGNVFLRLVESKENKDSKDAEPEEVSTSYLSATRHARIFHFLIIMFQ